MTQWLFICHGGANPVTGYGVFAADTLEEAIELARGCPILKDGGSVEIAATSIPESRRTTACPHF